MAAMMMEAAAGDIEFKDGAFRIVGTDRAHAAHRRGARRSTGRRCCRRNSMSGSKPPARSRPSRRTIPNGCHVCEVEVDPETGAVTLARYAAVDDVGKIMNHLLCEGQIHGGVAQGVGQALMEAIVFDSDGPARHRQLPGLRHAARRRFSRPCLRADRGAGEDQSARRQGRGRSRRHRRAAGGDRRHPRCAQAARHRAHRHAGDAEPGVGGDQRARATKAAAE